MPRKLANKRLDVPIGKIAARQHGVITTAQLEAAGVLSSGISDRVTAGRLHRIHRGVYAVGHPKIGNEGRWMAAVLACGDGAVLSHRSAAAIWKIGPVAPVIEVTVASDSGRATRKGIRLHRSRTLSPADLTRRAGIPVTTPARTLADLRRILPSKSSLEHFEKPSTFASRSATRSSRTEPAATWRGCSSPWLAGSAFPSRT